MYPKRPTVSLLWFVFLPVVHTVFCLVPYWRPTSVACDWLTCVPFVVCGLAVLETFPFMLSTS
ncbi:hypothetical protein CGRA01v4_08799 [Colletotrichum graminicola]|nr:hypothetical protein CGRA01v4_08799 [Colletotrichum graminicola]